MTDELAVKHAKVTEYLSSHDLDAVLLGRRCNFSWYTCGAHNYVANTCDVGGSWLLVSRERACVFADNIEAARFREEELPGEIELIEYPYFDLAAQSEAIRQAIGTMRAACDAEAALSLPRLAPDFDPLRWTLSRQEIRRYRSVCDDTVAALEKVARGQPETVAQYLPTLLHAAKNDPLPMVRS